MTNPLHEAFTTFAPEPRFVECHCCMLVFETKTTREESDGYLCSDCWQRCQELLEGDDEGHIRTFNAIFKGVARVGGIR